MLYIILYIKKQNPSVSCLPLINKVENQAQLAMESRDIYK